MYRAPNGKAWCAHIHHGGKKNHLGTFATEDAAVLVREGARCVREGDEALERVLVAGVGARREQQLAVGEEERHAEREGRRACEV